MKNLVLGLVVFLFGLSILIGNVTHHAYDLFTIFAVVCVVVGLVYGVKGFKERKAL
jgi:hypothetical protein